MRSLHITTRGLPPFASTREKPAQQWRPSTAINKEILFWCESNHGFALLNFAICYKNTFLNKCGYVIHHFNAHFLLYGFFFLLLMTYYLLFILYLFRLGKSVQFSHSAMSDSLWPHGLQHARLPCPSPTPRAYSNSCPSSQWCHPTISSSVVPFSSRLQSFPASGSFPVSQFFAYWSFSFSISPSNE